MKKLILMFMAASIFISFSGAQSTEIENVKAAGKAQISGALEKTTDLISEVIPENSSLLSAQPDAFIGKFIPSIPMHFSAGTSFSATFIKTEKLNSAMTDLSNGISETLKAGNATDGFSISFNLPENIPVPTAAFAFRLGGIFLPFDAGIHGATTFNGAIKDISFDDFNAGLDYTTIGIDFRYAILDGSGFLPKFSAGAGYIYSKFSLDFEASKTFTTNGTYTNNGIQKEYSANLKSDVNISSTTHTIFAQAQLSKKLLVFEPYIGTKLFVTKTVNEYDWKYNTYIENNLEERLSDADKKTETTDFSDENVSTQFFGGLGITLAKFQITLNGAYNVKTNYWSAGLGFNFKN